MGLKEYYKRSCGVTRVLNIGGDGKFTNVLMNPVVDIIAKLVANGIECITCLGEQCVLFLDPVAFIVDCLVFTALTDAIGHSKDVFCIYSCYPYYMLRPYKKVLFKMIVFDEI